MGIRNLMARRQTPNRSESSADFLHVVLTRFNMGAFNERWLEYRQELFEALTLPSMDAQTERNFLWVLAIDLHTPPQYRKRLDEIVESRPYIRLVEVELFAEFRSTLIPWCLAEAKSVGASHILSTRIDSDDVLHAGLFERIQHHAREVLATGGRLPAAIAPTTGYRWVPATGRGHRAYDNCPSTGTSMLEPVDAFESVYIKNHRHLLNWVTTHDGYIKAIDGDTRWWMHATTDASLTVLLLGDHRRDHTMGRQTVQDMDDEILRPFGVTAGAHLRSLEEPEFVENYQEIMERGNEIDKQIKEVRGRLQRQRAAGKPEDPELGARYSELHEQRRENSRLLMD